MSSYVQIIPNSQRWYVGLHRFREVDSTVLPPSHHSDGLSLVKEYVSSTQHESQKVEVSTVVIVE